VPFWLLAAMTNSEVLGSFAACLGLYLGIAWTGSLFKQPTLMLGYLKIGGVSLLTMMSLGWLMAQFFNLTSLDQSLSQALVKDVRTTLPAYASAVAYTLVFAAMLGILGSQNFVKGLEAHAVARLLAARSIRLHKLLALIAAICALEVVLIASDVIGYRTFAIEGFDEGRIPWYLPMLQILFAAQIGLNALAISQIVKNKIVYGKLAISIVIVSILLILFITFTQGRSGFMFCAMLHLFWIIFFMERIPKLRTTALVLLVVLPLLYSGALAFNFMRSSAMAGIDQKELGLVAFLNSAVQIWQSDQGLKEVEKARSASNLASRPLVAHPLAKSMALPSNQKNFLLGENLLNSAVWAIPSFIISDKKKYPVQEDLLYPNFPIGIDDTADSPYLYAYTDFGYVGLIIYPMLLAAIWVVILLMTRLPYISSLGVLVFVTVWISMFTLSLGEASMVSWFSLLRNTLIVIPFIIILAKLFSFPRRAAKNNAPYFWNAKR
jgi:hypothetical protein